MRKIYYVNELGYHDGSQNFDVHRLPQAYIHYLDWHSLSYDSINNISLQSDSILIFQTPCNDELRKLTIIKQYIDQGYICLITQESSIFDWFDWPSGTQEIYVDILAKCSAFLYHNEHDKNVMKIFCKTFIKYPGCTNVSIDDYKQFEFGQYVILPNPIKRYQRGMIVHKLAAESIGNAIPIYSMKYNAPNVNHQLAFPGPYSISPIRLYDYMNKDQWLQFIYSCKFGIDINREFSGGNCSLEFASLGTPMIGNIHLDVQRELFPDTSFEYTDYDNIQKTIRLLLYDKDFYEHVSKTALHNVKTLYNSKNITNIFLHDLHTILKFNNE
jgi:hypothetical protein